MRPRRHKLEFTEAVPRDFLVVHESHRGVTALLDVAGAGPEGGIGAVVGVVVDIRGGFCRGRKWEVIV